MRHVLDLETAPVSFRSACDMSRACSPICASPISPSISAFGTSAATESTTTTSTPPDRIRTSTISSACSPLSGCDTNRLSRSTPSFWAYAASSACSASARDAADAQRVVDADRARGNRIDRLNRALLAQAHDGPLAELLLDLTNGQLHGLGTFAVHPVVFFGSIDSLDGGWHSVLLPERSYSKSVPGESQWQKRE